MQLNLNRVWCIRHHKCFAPFLMGFLHNRLRLLHHTQFRRRVSDRSVALAASCSSGRRGKRSRRASTSSLLPSNDAWVVYHRPTGPYLVARWLLLSLWSSIPWSPRSCWSSIRCNLLLRCVCWDQMNCGFIIWIFMRSNWVFYELYYAWLFVFLSDLFIWFGQLDWFIFSGRGALYWVQYILRCFNGFNISCVALYLSDRRGQDTYLYHCH